MASSKIENSPVAIYLHISDRVTRKYVSITLIDPWTGSSTLLGKMDASVVYVPRNNVGSFLVVSAFCSKRSLNPFKWKLVANSVIPLREIELQLTIPERISRYTGFYMPNNELKIFKENYCLSAGAMNNKNLMNSQIGKK